MKTRRIAKLSCTLRPRWQSFVLVWLAVLTGCAQEERVTRYHPFMANLPDVKMGTAPVGNALGNAPDPTAGMSETLVIEHPNGTKTLVSANIRQLIYHLMNCLANDELELFYDQLVAADTKQHYRGKGKDGFAFMEFLKQHEEDVAMLVSRMPMAEHTPSVALDQPSRNVFKLRLTGLAKVDINFTVLWAVHDKGTWKLMWIE